MKKAGVFFLVIMVWLTTATWTWASEYNPKTAYDPVHNRFLVVFENALPSEDVLIYGRFLDSRGAAIGEDFNIYDGGYTFKQHPAVTFNPVTNQFLVVWQEDYTSIYGRLVNPDGTFGSDAAAVSGISAYSQSDPTVIFSPGSGEFLVVWEYTDIDYSINIVGRRVVENNGNLVSPDKSYFPISTGTDYYHLYPTAATDTVNGQFLVAWEKVSVSTYTSQGLGACLVSRDGLADSQFDATAGADLQSPAVAYDTLNNQFLVVWEDDTLANDANVYGQLIPADGNLAINPLAISTAVGDQRAPTVAYDPAAGHFLVAWQDYRSLTDMDIYGQAVADGALSGDEIKIATTTSDQVTPNLAYNADCANMLTAYVSSATGDDLLDYAFVGDLCPIGSGTTVAGGTSQSAYRMITFPVSAQPDLGTQMAAQLGGFNSAQWRLYRWDPATETYLELEDPLWGADQACVPGRAYWFISRKTAAVTITGNPPPSIGAVEVVLKPGWNQVGSPYDFDVLWDSNITVTQGTIVDPANESSLTGSAVWQWNAATGEYVQAPILVQGQGYWLENRTAADVILTIPADNRYIAGIWRHIRSYIARWTSKFPSSAVAAGSTPPPPPGALEETPETGSSGCFISTTTPSH